MICAILAEKNEDNVYVNQDESLTDLQTLIKYSFLLNFLHESLVNLININIIFIYSHSVDIFICDDKHYIFAAAQLIYHFCTGRPYKVSARRTLSGSEFVAGDVTIGFFRKLRS